MIESSEPQKPSAQVRLERLLAASLMLATEVSLERVLQKVTEIAVDLIDARYAALGVLAQDGRTLESFTTTGMTAEERQRIGAPPSFCVLPRAYIALVKRSASPN